VEVPGPAEQVFFCFFQGKATGLFQETFHEDCLAPGTDKMSGLPVEAAGGRIIFLGQTASDLEFKNSVSHPGQG
jgi:hypothetical protein